MKTITEVLERHATAPRRAATELVARFDHSDERTVAADAWCATFAAAAHTLPPSSLGEGTEKEGRAVTKLLDLACAGSPILGELVLRAGLTSARESPTTTFNFGLLSAILAMWPSRASLEQLPALLREWRRRVDSWTASAAAWALEDTPGLAYAILGRARYVPPTGPCYGCATHPRDPDDTGHAHVRLLFERRRFKRPSVPEDELVLSTIPGSALVREPMLARAMWCWLVEGLEPPATLWEGIEEVLQTTAERDREHALTLLCASQINRQQDRAIAALAADTIRATEPASVLQDFSRSSTLLLAGQFRSPGWGRELRRRRLLPLSRALLSKRAWPVEAWLRCLTPPAENSPTASHAGDAREAGFEAQREVLAEAFLSIALADEGTTPERIAALDALEALRPGGDGSWAKALSKIEDDGGEVFRRARDVQRALRRLRDSPADAELSIADACEIYFAKSQHR